MSSKTLPLFYWSEIKFINKTKENYGDLLSKYIAERISGKDVKWVHPKKQSFFKWDKKNYLAIGSIIHHATEHSIVWGSGIIDRKQNIDPADFRAVRGPITRKYLIDKGYECPEVYGDPALLLPQFYNPTVEKKYKLAVIPHYHDFNLAKEIFGNIPEVLLIDLMTMDVEDVTNQILSCEKSISSSLHGMIVSHSYNIPSVWVEFSKKLFGDGVKFKDYFKSVGIEPYIPKFFKEKETFNMEIFKRYPSLPTKDKLDELRDGLMLSCPFNKSEFEGY